MGKPFTPKHVARYCLWWLLAIAAVFGLYFLLMHATGHQSILPGKPQARLRGATAGLQPLRI